jgi:bifunctional UDP-N-acetylglucosamine pyrophosphorylase/glucosamine-1-phosphate N-acetyltransferase
MKELAVVVLAAGEGTRMRSDLPKVLHALGGRPMLAHVLAAADALGPDGPRVAVVGRAAELVRPLLEGAGWEAVLQGERLGTGHALGCAAASLEGWRGDLLILCGDTPLITPAALRALVARHRRSGAPLTILTSRPSDPAGYGRIQRDDQGRVTGIVEQKELRAGQDASEVNTGFYVARWPDVSPLLPSLVRHRRSGEYYLTDLAAALAREGRHPASLTLPDPTEALGINDRIQLAAAAGILRGRVLERLMAGGVTVVDPAATWVDAGVKVGRDTVLHPGVVLQGATVIGTGCSVGPHARVSGSRLGDGVAVLDGSVVEESRVGRDAVIGPMARLRPGTVVGAAARVGNFVEVKKCTLGAGVKASHLTYLGDAEVGAGTNIGAGVVTCNYDGVRKHRTVIGPGVFVGSDVMLVAPLTVGKGAVLGAGSVITKDVPAEALAVSRPQLTLREGWGRRRRTARE